MIASSVQSHSFLDLADSLVHDSGEAGHGGKTMTTPMRPLVFVVLCAAVVVSAQPEPQGTCRFIEDCIPQGLDDPSCYPRPVFGEESFPQPVRVLVSAPPPAPDALSAANLMLYYHMQYFLMNFCV